VKRRSEAHLAGEQQRRVVVLGVPGARRVEELLPGAEAPQGHAPVAGGLRPRPLILQQQQPHHHHAHRVLDAGVSVELGGHGHQGQDVVLWGAHTHTHTHTLITL